MARFPSDVKAQRVTFLSSPHWLNNKRCNSVKQIGLLLLLGSVASGRSLHNRLFPSGRIPYSRAEYSLDCQPLLKYTELFLPALKI